MLKHSAVNVDNILTNTSYILPEDYQRGRDTVIVFIPGNPGIIEFYDSFLQQLYENCGIPIFGVSYAGRLDIPQKKKVFNKIESGHPR